MILTVKPNNCGVGAKLMWAVVCPKTGRIVRLYKTRSIARTLRSLPSGRGIVRPCLMVLVLKKGKA